MKPDPIACVVCPLPSFSPSGKPWKKRSNSGGKSIPSGNPNAAAVLTVFPSTLIFTTAALFCLINVVNSGKPPAATRGAGATGCAIGAAIAGTGVTVAGAVTPAGAGIGAGVVSGAVSATTGNATTLSTATPSSPVANASLLRLNMGILLLKNAIGLI